jgi:hypothetical protein
MFEEPTTMNTPARKLRPFTRSAATLKSLASTLVVLAALPLATGCAGLPTEDEGTQTASAPRVVERDLGGSPRVDRRPRKAP